MTWEELDEWWISQLEDDPDYEGVVTPLLLDLLGPVSGRKYLDVGCGEGRVMRRLRGEGATVTGVDGAQGLLSRAAGMGPVVLFRLPSLACFADATFDGCVVSLVLEHLSDHETFFTEVARVTRPYGVLALVANHPVFTAPGSAPIQDYDGEILWRPGRYLTRGVTEEPIGPGRIVRFHHRPLGELLTVASEAGWDLRRLVETGPSDGQIERLPNLASQRHFVRLIGARWTRRT